MPSATPSTSEPKPPATFPLAVVTGLTNLKANVSINELRALAAQAQLVMPCGVVVTSPALGTTPKCTVATDIRATLEAARQRIALLPPGLVEPATKVLSVAGTGPFGMFGPDLFGDAQARALPYAIRATAQPGGPKLDPAWTAYDGS